MKYTGEQRKEISFPLGGIGTGSIGLGGDGRLIDWEIFNRPSKGSAIGFSHFAIRALKDGKITARILNGDVMKNFTGQYERAGNYNAVGFGFGPNKNNMCGFPHFEDVTFYGEFPIAAIDFRDRDFSGSVSMTAFNPFIPLDAT